jgi:hypothetical protein
MTNSCMSTTLRPKFAMLTNSMRRKTLKCIPLQIMLRGDGHYSHQTRHRKLFVLHGQTLVCKAPANIHLHSE